MMEGDISGVRILPPVLEFFDTEPNKVYQLNINVTNISKDSKKIRYYAPKFKSFTLKVKNPEQPVAPGLGVAALVEYKTHEEKEKEDRIVITVNGEVLTVPIHAYPSRAVLELPEVVDFGNAVANCKVIAKEIILYNYGSKSGEFEIKYSGSRPITINPNSGSVAAQSHKKIKVEYMAEETGKFDEVAVVKLKGKPPTTLKIKGNIVQRGLELLSFEDGEPLKCIKFGSTYYGTDLTQCALLFNNGPEPINFVAVLDEDAIGQELGVDLTQTASALIADEIGGRIRKGETNVLTSLFTAIPNQGILKPYQKIPVFFRFSPRWHPSQQGWKGQINSPPRKDFVIFMRLEIVGSNKGFSQGSSSGHFAEVSLTGTALPVLLSILPTQKYDFGECSVGESIDVLCTINNESQILPATFVFRHIAHFTVHPSNGTVNPGQTQDVIFSFSPNQAGSFKSHQLVYVIGQVADQRNPTVVHPEVISTLTIKFVGSSNPVSKKPTPKFNPGITPLITNEVGMYVDTKFGELRTDYLRNAVLGATRTKLHHLKIPSSTLDDLDVKVAFPNDLTHSVRPTERKEKYKSLFTRRERHNYVDPDYAYSDEELTERKTHRAKYIKLFKELREKRVGKMRLREFWQTNNPIDIGIKNAAGLKPRELTLEEIKQDPSVPEPPNSMWKLLSTKELTQAEKETMSKPIRDGLNAIPTTNREKRDCLKILSPQQLHQLVIGPPVIDFGKVCLKSTNQKNLNIVNNLSQYIHVVAEIDSRELRQSSPLSQVVPPKSKATIPILFESNTKGKFQRSVIYTVNGFYRHHVTIVADVVPISLDLSTENLILHPCLGMPADAGFRGVVTLYNRMNYQAEFTWSPNIEEKGTAFSIRPATGVVNPFTDLDCEVVWHPSYMAPEDGSFTLICHGGNTLQFHCKAVLGPTSVQFVERRISFGTVPVNLTTTRTAMLNNTGHNHAYFQVLDPNPFPGLTVSPVHGLVPVGGDAELYISLTPDAVLKFDTNIQVAIKGSSTIELRMGGTVEPPCVEIDIPSFNLGGVYCGSGSTIPFQLINKTGTKAKVEFDLVRYKDFTLAFPGFQNNDDFGYQMLNPGMYSVTLAPKEVAQGELTFMPTEVAAYDFVMPVIINHIGAPSPAPTPFPPTPAPSQKNSLQHIINPRPQPVTVATPRKHVIATALRQPLQMSTNRIEFSLPTGYNKVVQDTGVGQAKPIVLVNNSTKSLIWGFDLSRPSRALDEGIIKFIHPSGVPFTPHSDCHSKGIEGQLDPGQTQEISVVFSPNQPGKVECLIPIVINDEWEKPYQFLQVFAELNAPKMWFVPPAIGLTPSPLKTEVSCEFSILFSHYREQSTVSYELPEIECDDGSKITPLRLVFPTGQEIKPCCEDEGHIDPYTVNCMLYFSSPKPVSFSKPIIFKDDKGKSFSLIVTATADNCLLTCYPFLALHRDDHKIVCEQGSYPKGHKLQPATAESKDSSSVGEAVFVPCASPVRLSSRPSTSATSSNFQVSTSSYETDSVSDSCVSTPKVRDGAMNKPPSVSERGSPVEVASRMLGSVIFPDEDSEEGIFHMEVLLSVQRWFSSLGWPNGPFPIIIPETLRVAISHNIYDREQKGRDSIGETTSKKDCRTIYDMISHLSGRPVPGIPYNSALPTDPIERVKEIYWRHSTLLTFLKCQGGCVAAIRPEHLMPPRDYSLWKQLQSQIQQVQTESEGEDGDEELEEDVFEAVSKRAWTDVLLQILKCLVLAKVTPRTLKNIASPDKTVALPNINPDPLSSNIYSVGERIILTWLNHNYEHFRCQVWENCSKGGVPSSRWIVNYDFDLLDGLVIGAVIGAHLPFLIKSHLEQMYTHPSTAEQCLHNALCVVNAMRLVGIDYDIQAIDITDPNPVALLLLCIHLYQRLPQYLPKASVEFTGALHATVTRQVKLSNPSQKSLTYQVLVAGHDARDFHVPRGDHVTVPARSTLSLSVEFVSRFLRPAEAILVLVGRRQGSAVGTTLTFNLRTQIDNIEPKEVVVVESPCYELERIMINVTNPFNEGGEFQLVLVESNVDASNSSKSNLLNAPQLPKKKKVTSKVNHGKNQASTTECQTATGNDTKDMTDGKKSKGKISDDTPNILSAFFSPMTSIYLKPHAAAEVEVHFLPFAVGNRQCSVIFLNEKIGEFLYSIEAKATLPLPSVLPFVPTTNSVRISSAAAAGTGKGMFGGDDRVIYWKCEAGQILKEKLLIPITNMAKERALIIAAQQHMSDCELHRRHVTGTLMSCSVTAKTLKMLSSDPEKMMQKYLNRQYGERMYTVEGDSDYFVLPNKILLPSPLESRSHSAPPDVKVPKGVNLADGVVELPVQFKSAKPGHYPCEIVLKSQDDVRVYRIECTVNPQGNTLEMAFITPVHQSVTQVIPIINMTNHDWQLKAKLTGDGFFGPPSLFVKAYQTANYPLSFKPMYEKEIQGKLILSNEEDGTDHTFYLNGKAEQPLALDNIKLDCQAKQSTCHTISVPNTTKSKLTYYVTSDLPFVSGHRTVSVLASHTGKYDIIITPKKRGMYKGILTLIAGRSSVVELDSDGDDFSSDENDSHGLDGYRIWYSLEVNVSPPPPERCLEVSCHCLQKAILDVIVRNPTLTEIDLEATVTGNDLTGPPNIKVAVGEKDTYSLIFEPTAVGRREASLVFYNDLVGEFWYKLILNALPPAPTTLPHMECELGRWTKETITLENPTEETLELTATISNTNNFYIERDNERPITLKPKSQIDLSLHFMPSSLGEDDHNAEITFSSKQFGDWMFYAKGTGQLPQPQDTVSVYTTAGSNTTLIIPFRNPFDVAVLADVMLTDRDTQMENMEPDDGNTPFSLLLKRNTGIRIGPKSVLDIPISFAPSEMHKYESVCTVVVQREDGMNWLYVPLNEEGFAESSSSPDGIKEIRWLFPIKGIPESKPVRESQAAVIECSCRKQLDMRLEVSLAGMVANPAGPQKPIRIRARTPSNTEITVPEGIVVGETLATTDEFSYEISFPNEDAMKLISNCLHLSLMRQHRDTLSGLVVLVFDVSFKPLKPMLHDVELHVTGATGGRWKFPLHIKATEAPVDDTVMIEATGLNKISAVGFKLHSHICTPVDFVAFFEAGSDPEFVVSPQSGQLLPPESEGTPFTINFRPALYGKLYQAKLIIQTPDMQWSYSVKGVLPEYTPPLGKSSHPMAGPHPDPRVRGEHISYITENLKLTTTAVSSPIKGAPLLPVHKIH